MNYFLTAMALDTHTDTAKTLSCGDNHNLKDWSRHAVCQLQQSEP
jgi:hypothetical protein